MRGRPRDARDEADVRSVNYLSLKSLAAATAFNLRGFNRIPRPMGHGRRDRLDMFTLGGNQHHHHPHGDLTWKSCSCSEKLVHPYNFRAENLRPASPLYDHSEYLIIRLIDNSPHETRISQETHRRRRKRVSRVCKRKQSYLT